MTIPFEGGLSHYTDKLDSVCNCCYSVTYCSNTVREGWDIESAMILGEGCRDSVEGFVCQSVVKDVLVAVKVCMCRCVCIYKIVPVFCAFCESNVTLSKRVEMVWVTGVNLCFRAGTQ